MKVHPRDNDLVIATHARGFYILDDATPLQQLAKASSVTLFPPMRATRYTPASDTSVLGNRVWVARNRPYGAIINYYLPDASTAAPTVTIADRSGRIVRMLPGTGRAGAASNRGSGGPTGHVRRSRTFRPTWHRGRRCWERTPLSRPTMLSNTPSSSNCWQT